MLALMNKTKNQISWVSSHDLYWENKMYKRKRSILRFRRTWTTTANFLKFYFKFIAVSQIQFRDSFDSDKQSKWFKSIPRLVGKI